MLPVDVIVALGEDWLAALTSLHGEGRVHGAIHPDVVVEEGGVGVLRAGTALPPATRLAVEGPDWVAPEQATSEAADVYVIAAVLFQCATGRHPFQGPGGDATQLARMKADAVPLPSSLRPELPRRIDGALVSALAADPGSRPSAASLLQRWTHGSELSERVEAVQTSTSFPETRWSMVLRAGVGRRTALEALCGAYWYPLYAWVRRQGTDPVLAQDVVQSFLADVLARQDLERIDPTRGRFRSWLLASLRNHQHKQRRHDAAQKRGADVTVPLDAETRYAAEDDADPETLFHRAWAHTVLDRARDRLGAEYARRGLADRFEALRPAITTEGLDDYEAVAAALGVSVSTVKVTVHRMRKRLAVLARDEVAQTTQPELLDAEMDALKQGLGFLDPRV